MNKIESVFYNGFLGDQLGAPYEFKTHEEIKKIYDSNQKLPATRYTAGKLESFSNRKR